jgi:O-antigen ligase
LLLRGAAVGIGVAGVVFTLSYANGGFAPTTRAYGGLAAWWILGAGAAIGIASARSSIDRLALVSLGLFAAFAVWILISIRWASDPERAFAQFNQVSLYVAVFAIAIVIARLVPASWVVGGVALALSAIAAVALVSRFFPSSFGVKPGEQLKLLEPLASRLSFPLGYWNGLGIGVALAYPLLLAIMTSRRSRVASTLAALPLPIVAAVMYLTSSRGAFVAAALGALVFVVLTPKRWPALAALIVAGAGGAAAVAALVHKRALVDGQGTAVAAHQGHRAAAEIGIACVLGALVWLGLTELGKRVPSPPRVIGVAVAAGIAILAIVAIVAAHPVQKFDDFKNNSSAGTGTGFTTTSHLLGSSGSGRWQFWSAAVSQFRAHPLNGGGAGSWGAWWLQHGSLPVFTQFAHSLYLESLGELGIIGLLLIGGAVVVGLVGAVRSAVLLESGEIAAAAACAFAFFAAAAYDWVWQLAGIAVVGVGMLGLALGALPSQGSSGWGRFGALRPVLALVAVAAIIPQYVALASGSHLRNAQDAVDAAKSASVLGRRALAAGDETQARSDAAQAAAQAARARSEALRMKALMPWAATPYFELAVLSQYEGDFTSASQWIDMAIHRSPRDWNLWTRAAIIETRAGNARAARRALAEARLLNPNYFASLKSQEAG